jgi:hypothetical protein
LPQRLEESHLSVKPNRRKKVDLQGIGVLGEEEKTGNLNRRQHQDFTVALQAKFNQITTNPLERNLDFRVGLKSHCLPENPVEHPYLSDYEFYFLFFCLGFRTNTVVINEVSNVYRGRPRIDAD